MDKVTQMKFISFENARSNKAIMLHLHGEFNAFNNNISIYSSKSNVQDKRQYREKLSDCNPIEALSFAEKHNIMFSNVSLLRCRFFTLLSIMLILVDLKYEPLHRCFPYA